MDFKDTPEEAAFRAEVREWLDENATRKKDPSEVSRNGDLSEAEALARAKDWQARKAEAGYATIHWPKGYGGGGMPIINTVIYQIEEANYDVPRGFFEIGLGMCGPTMMMYATEEQKQRYLPKMIKGEEIWSQLFSEPYAGSDVAALRMKAERDGDDWVLNGQKVWTSGAYFSDYGIIVTRHDPNVPKHKGLTFFFIDLKSPGIEIKRIKQISGQSHFCEVFFTDVRVPDTQRLGAVGQGWSVSLTTLMNERLAIGGAPPPDFEQLFGLAKKVQLEDGPAIQNAAVREKLADWYVQSQGLKYTRFRTLTALSKGQTPGPEASIGKVVSASKLQDIASFGQDLMDMGGSLMDEELTEAHALFQEAYLYAPGFRIAGGTDEILRNIIAERVLGLPGDIRVDKEVPFNKLPTGKF
jgi:alkylation response protein AidB-like acyl-CoA dehydrogenase